MLQQSHRRQLETIKKDLLLMQGQLRNMNAENGGQDVFGNTINNLSDTIASLKRETEKITFNDKA